MSRIIAAVSAFVLAAAVSAPARAQERLRFKAIGQPLATGLIEKNKEQPFFENFAAKTGLPIDVDYKPIDTLGLKDTEQLRVMKAGLFDIVSLRVSQTRVTSLPSSASIWSAPARTTPPVARSRRPTSTPSMPGCSSSSASSSSAFMAFGPEILFCKKPITKLADVKGLKVRVYDQNLAKFIELVGGTPVPISFADTHQLLSLGVVDCAVTGPSSANSAGWPEVTTHQLPLGFQMALNGYVITLKAWTELKPDQQTKLKAAFDTLTEEIWSYSEDLFQDALNCNAGKDPGKEGKKFKLVNAPVTSRPTASWCATPSASCPAGRSGRGVRQSPTPSARARRSGSRRWRRCWGTRNSVTRRRE